MSRLTRWLDSTCYSDFPAYWDDLLLRDWVLAVLTPETDMLDLGAGRGNRTELDFRGRCRFIAGTDPDEAIFENPFLDEAKLQFPPDFAIPYEDGRFDLVMANNVLEHVDNPSAFFNEVKRVLRPGGVFIGKTPNRYHYVPVFARLLPHSFHVWYNKLRGREAHDTFPTVYACNSVATVRAVTEEVGMELARIDVVEGRPEYLRLTFPTYLVGLLYERIVNAWSGFRNLRCVLMIQIQKRS